MRTVIRHSIVLAVVAAVAVLAGACADRSDGAPPTDPARAEAARIVATEVELGVDGVDPESVVVAAMLLTTGGDIDAALADGVITDRDLDAAVAGLESGALDELFD